MRFRTYLKQWTGCALSLAALSIAYGQQDWRSLVVHSDDTIAMTCGVEMTMGNDRHVVLGDQVGSLTFYRYTPNTPTITRVGRVFTPYSSISDVSAVPITNGQRIFAVSSGRLFAMDYTGSDVRVWGQIQLPSNNLALRVSLQGNEIAVATNRYTVQIYTWSNPAQYGNYDTLIALTPYQTIAVPAPITTVRYASNSVLLVGGSNGVVYAFVRGASGFSLQGKAMEQFSPIVEMVPNGNYLAVACADGYIRVWDWSIRQYVLTIKDPWYSRLEPHCLTALPNNLMAVGASSVRIYNLSNGALVGAYGSPMAADISYPEYSTVPFPHFLSSRLLPRADQNSFFVMGTGSNDLGSVTFAQRPVNPLYQTASHRLPVYALDSVRSAGRVWVAYADGSIARYNASNFSLAASFSATEPVFAIREITIANQPVLLYSWGANGALSARQGSTSIAVIPPSATDARVLYDFTVIGSSFSSGADVLILTVSSNGRLELWRWRAGVNQPAELVQSLPVPTTQSPITLRKLTLNSDQTRVVVASNQGAWTVPLSLANLQNPFGTPSTLTAERVYDAKFHPSDPDLLALSQGFSVRVYHYTNSALSGTLKTAYSYGLRANPFLLEWRDTSQLVCAPLFGDMVLVCATNVPKAIGPIGYAPFALQEAYEIRRDGFFALDVDPQGVMTVGSVDGSVTAWNALGKPTFRTYLNSILDRIDFMPVNGQLVYANHWTPFQGTGIHAVFGYNIYGVRNPDDPSQLRSLRVLVPQTGLLRCGYVFPNAAGTALTGIGVGSDYRSILGANVDVSEDGRWVFTPKSATLNNNQLQVSFERTSHTGSVSAVTPSTAFGNPGTSYLIGSAASPSGNSFAIGVSSLSEIKIGTFANNTWSWTSINREGSGDLAIEYLTENVLMIAYRRNNNIWVELFERVGATWVQRQSFNTGLPWGSMTRGMVDAITHNNQTRVALAGWSGLVFYRLTVQNGQAELVEIGRSLAADNAYMLFGRINWVRFSRYNPNFVGVVDGAQSIVLNTSSIW